MSFRIALPQTVQEMALESSFLLLLSTRRGWVTSQSETLVTLEIIHYIRKNLPRVHRNTYLCTPTKKIAQKLAYQVEHIQSLKKSYILTLSFRPDRPDETKKLWPLHVMSNHRKRCQQYMWLDWRGTTFYKYVEAIVQMQKKISFNNFKFKFNSLNVLT